MITNNDKEISAGVNQDEYSAIFDFNKQDAKVALKEFSIFSRFIKKITHPTSFKSQQDKDDALFKNIIDNETKHTK